MFFHFSSSPLFYHRGHRDGREDTKYATALVRAGGDIRRSNTTGGRANAVLRRETVFGAMKRDLIGSGECLNYA